MPGTFSKSNRPKRPGAYVNFISVGKETILPNSAGIVAMPLTHDWGPFKVPTLVSSLGEFQAVFGPSTDTAGYKAIYGAFKGEGLTGRGGAGSVLVYRYGTSAVKATAVHNQSPADTTPGLTLTAIYEGTYGNDLTSTVEDNAADAANNRDLVIKVGGIEVERYTYAKAGITALAAAINASSDWVTAVANAGSTEIVKSTKSFTTGADGTVDIAAADFTSALDGIEPQRFGVFALDDIAGTDWGSPATPTSILASLKTWAANLNVKGKRFLTVVGGALDESVTTANTRSTSLNHSDFVNIGVGGVEDATLGTLSTSQLAPRIAGILAACGEERSLTFARLAGVSARHFATESQILSAFDAGTVVLAADSHPDAPVRVEKGLTTYVSGDANKPYLIYRNPKYVRTTHGIETDITEWAENNVIGQVQISDGVRATTVGFGKTLLKQREDRGVLQPGSTVGIDSDPPPTDEDEFIALVYGVKFGRSLEQIYNSVVVA